MIERKDIQGTTVFIDHDRGEVHFSDRSNMICLASGFDQYDNVDESFSESPFGIFRIPGHEPVEEHPDRPRYEPDQVFCNAIDDTTLKSVIKNRFETCGSSDKPISDIDLLASENIQMIAVNIINTAYSDLLLYLSPRVLVEKEIAIEHTGCDPSILNELLTYGFLKENGKGELFFTFKGLVVRGELEKIGNQNNLQCQSQAIYT